MPEVFDIFKLSYSLVNVLYLCISYLCVAYLTTIPPAVIIYGQFVFMMLLSTKILFVSQQTL